MSSMKDAYLRQLRPMDGQQADPPEPKTETAPVHPDQQPLFVRGDVSVLAADLARMMEDDDDDHPVVAPFDPTDDNHWLPIEGEHELMFGPLPDEVPF